MDMHPSPMAEIFRSLLPSSRCCMAVESPVSRGRSRCPHCIRLVARVEGVVGVTAGDVGARTSGPREWGDHGGSRRTIALPAAACLGPCRVALCRAGTAMAFRYDGSGIHERYVAARRLTEEARETWARAISEHLGPGPLGRVLDVGCGTGRFSRLLRDVLSASVYAVDPSADMLGQAPRPDGVWLVRAAAEALP